MKTLEEFKAAWSDSSGSNNKLVSYDAAELRKLVRSKVGKHTRLSFQYFWASFALQLLVYGLMANVLVKHWSQSEVVLACLIGILSYIPFTIVLLQKFKTLALSKPIENEIPSIYNFVNKQKDLLENFYRFKIGYEIILIPISAAIGVFLTFQLWVPGGISRYGSAAFVIYVVTLISCMAAIIIENRKSFITPISRLQTLLDEFTS